MISGLDIRHRVSRDRNAMAAAKRAGIKHNAYPSLSGFPPPDELLLAAKAETES